MAAIDAAGLVSETYPVHDTLFFKIQGDPAAIKTTADAVRRIVGKHGSINFKFAQTDDEAEELWESRKYALMSTIESEEGARCWTTDVWWAVCVPCHFHGSDVGVWIVSQCLNYRNWCTRPRRTCRSLT